ncbi:acylphosphatase [Arthrobacter pigmenti]|uniref:acylphosphatase n=1 Tax=Arthrobacter pigmenti TaxID=271432 RepID=A0A846RK19_9MICC|nr:acylphosphatase [Arthrobacter pigmenti]NJC23583.1 acylphosphatase [Arthrobacter pigmenti]
MSNTVRLVATVTGEVQGVGFRYRTRQQAEQLGLVGSATNRPDGSVLVVAAGPPSSVEQLLRWLNSGGTPGRVEHVDATMHDDGASHLSGFDTD